MAETALVLVSHSRALAQGCADVAGQMAPDVLILPAGGDPDGGIGTSTDLVEAAVRQALEGAGEVLLLADLGSATLVAESVQEMLDDDRVLLADVPFVEGAVAAAVAAQGGANGQQVRTAARTAITSFAAADTEQRADDDGEPVRRTLTVRNRLGLHARPAAMLARQVAEFDAQVRVNGVDATSVLALMGLGLTGGARIDLIATGTQAEQAVEVIAADVEAGFGEE